MARTFTILLVFSFVCLSRSFGQSDDPARLEARLGTAKDTARVNVLNALAWKYDKIDTKKALGYAGSAQKLSEKLGYTRGKAFAAKNFGVIHTTLGNYTDAESWLKTALEEFHRTGDVVQQGNIHNLFGLLYWGQGNYDLAIRHYDKAGRFYDDARDTEGKVIVASNVGIICYEQNDYDAALASFYKALSDSEKFGNRRLTANLHTNIGLVYKELGNYRKALSEYRLSLAIESADNDISGQGMSFTNMAVAYYSLKELDTALHYHGKALTAFRKVNEQKGIARSLLNIGGILELKGRRPEAMSHLRESVALLRTINDRLGVAMALCELGRVQLNDRKPEEAIVSLRRAHELSTGLSSAKYRAVSSLMLAEAYEATGDAEAALAAYKDYSENSEKLDLELNNGSLAELQIGHETLNTQKEIRRLRERSEANLMKKRVAVYGGLTLLLLATLFFAWLRKKHRRERREISGELLSERSKRQNLVRNVSKLEHELEKSRIELRKFTQALAEKALRTENSPQEETLVREQEKMAALGELENVRIVTDDDWIAFKTHYNRAFPGFMSGLKERHPAITTAEIRLAALLKLQLSSREVASILGISGDSVKKLRQRLRKKMELDASESLEEALSPQAASQ
jgi:tetratricopeptide (TPR) repeat protein/DNA-binding CsgD family transcriptional regulator